MPKNNVEKIPYKLPARTELFLVHHLLRAPLYTKSKSLELRYGYSPVYERVGSSPVLSKLLLHRRSSLWSEASTKTQCFNMLSDFVAVENTGVGLRRCRQTVAALNNKSQHEASRPVVWNIFVAPVWKLLLLLFSCPTYTWSPSTCLSLSADTPATSQTELLWQISSSAF